MNVLHSIKRGWHSWREYDLERYCGRFQVNKCSAYSDLNLNIGDVWKYCSFLLQYIMCLASFTVFQKEALVLNTAINCCVEANSWSVYALYCFLFEYSFCQHVCRVDLCFFSLCGNLLVLYSQTQCLKEMCLSSWLNKINIPLGISTVILSVCDPHWWH